MEIKLRDVHGPVSKMVAGINCCDRIIYVCLLIIGVYFLWMDIGLYRHIQTRKVGENSLKEPDHHFTAFSDITIKLTMSDPANNYIHVPTAEVFDEVTHFSTRLHFITADVISICHFFVALLAAKMASLDSLCMRRIGVALFEFRTWLDALDGVVYRSHSQRKHNFSTQRFTAGYYFDSVSDVVGTTALCLAVLFHLRRNIPKKNIKVLPWRLPTKESGVHEDMPSKRSLLIKCVSFGILLAISGMTWDSYLEYYQKFLESKDVTSQQQVRQLAIIQSGSTWLIMWSWRLLNAHSFTEMILVAIFVDKIWEFLNWVQYVGTILLIMLVVATQIHVQYVQSAMGEFRTLKTS